MSATRKMLKAENTQLRAQLAATENMSRTTRIERLHELENQIARRDNIIANLQETQKKMADEIDRLNRKTDELEAELTVREETVAVDAA